MSTSPVLVYIIEDNPEHRTLLHEIMEPSGFRAREFVSGEEFLAVYDRLRLPAGIILLDLMLPGMDGASLVENLGGRGCWWPIVILTGHPGAAQVERALKAGALDVLRKPMKGALILAALERARSRLTVSQVDKPNPGILARFETLKPGERCVLEGMRGGLMDKQIATKCGVSERTVRTRVQQMLKKMGADSREHLLQLAVTAGMPVKPPV